MTYAVSIAPERCEALILREIADPDNTAADVAETIELARSTGEAALVDWSRIDAAIAARWSLRTVRRLGGGV